MPNPELNPPILDSEYSISTDRSKLDITVIHGFLRRSYWAKDIPLATVQKAIEHSLCFGVYQHHQQIGFARAITDYATFAYLADVFILEPYRGRGLGKWLVQYILNYPQLQNLRKWVLVTGDAHELYHRYGFTNLQAPENYLEIVNLNIYSGANSLLRED
jgi:GNAT superfamily N-acetyltransferase